MKILKHPDDLARGAIGLLPAEFDKGLLFVLPSAAPWPVSMENMDLPLDVFWLSESGMVLEHVELFPGMPVYWPECSARYVVEFPMDATPAYKVGDFMELPSEP